MPPEALRPIQRTTKEVPDADRQSRQSVLSPERPFIGSRLRSRRSFGARRLPEQGRAIAKWSIKAGAVITCLLALRYLIPEYRPRYSRDLTGPNKAWSSEGCVAAIQTQQEVLLETFESSLRKYKHVALLGYPDHENKGDSAIWVGEKILLAALGKETVFQSSWKGFREAELQEAIQKHPNLVILLHGGGNFGDLYMWELRPRFKIVEEYPHIPIRFFPQSIHFDSSSNIALVADMLADHPDLQLFVRDEPSWEFAAEHFRTRGVNIQYAPDCAFMIGSRPDLRKEFEPKHDILVFHRTDIEGDKWTENLTWPADFSFKHGDWLDPEYNVRRASSYHFDARAYERLRIGAAFLRQGRMPIVDRLHGHIVSLLLGIPHVVLDNRIGKLSAYHRSWTSGCRLALFARSPKEALELATSTVKALQQSDAA